MALWIAILQFQTNALLLFSAKVLARNGASNIISNTYQISAKVMHDTTT